MVNRTRIALQQQLRARSSNRMSEEKKKKSQADAGKAEDSDAEMVETPAADIVETSVEQIKLAEPVKAYFIGNSVVVREDFEQAQQFFDRSCFGEIHGVKEKRLEFSLIEALYLLDRKKIRVFDGKKELNFEQFVKKASRLEKNFWTRYRIYRDIRTRGYIVKTALKFGADFRVYRRGVKPGEDHAKWVLFATAEGEGYTWREFAAMNRVAHSTRKKLMVGIVDEEGECTFYEVHWKKP